MKLEDGFWNWEGRDWREGRNWLGELADGFGMDVWMGFGEWESIDGFNAGL